MNGKQEPRTSFEARCQVLSDIVVLHLFLPFDQHECCVELDNDA